MTGDGLAPHRVVSGRIRAPRAQGVRRSQLVERLTSADHRLGVVVAPAGSGKTTLLAQAAAASRHPVAWLTLDAAAGDTAAFLAHLRVSLEVALPGPLSGWRGVDDTLADLEALTEPLLLVLDDLHTVTDRPAMDAVRLLTEYQPQQLRLLIAARSVPGIDVPRLRLGRRVLEIGADDLRFRVWEVERLFRDHYQVRLHPEELAALARRTGGWAAGLQLFHLATSGRPASERTRILTGLGVGSRLTREYLTETVLDAVSADLRAFLLRTSVLDELTAPRCDRLLTAASGTAAGGAATSGSAGRLAELERRGLFTFLDADGRTYCYHDVLRAHLLETLALELGQDTARALHRRAGEILQQEGMLADAVRAYSRAEDWDEVRRLLGQQGRHLADDPGSWIDGLPPEIRASDPWVLLALGRRLVAEGDLQRAREVYRQAIARLDTHTGLAALELSTLERWLEPRAGRATDWVEVARGALADPRQHRRAAPPEDLGQPRAQETYQPVPLHLAHCLAHLVAGELTAARAGFERVAGRRDAGPVAEAAALIGRAACCALAADPDTQVAVAEARTAAKLLGLPAVLRLAQAVALLAPGAEEEEPAGHLVGECERADDAWGGAVARLLHGLRRVMAGSGGAAELRHAAAACAALDAPALAAWGAAAALVADVQEGRLPSPAQVSAAERAGAAAGPLPYATALLGVAAAEERSEPGGQAGAHALRLATVLADRCGAGGWLRGLRATIHPSGRQGAEPAAPPDQDAAAAAAAPSPAEHPAPEARDRPPSVLVRCLGKLEVTVDGTPLDLSAVQPQNLALLRILCLHANRPVHRERLVEWLWPDRDPSQGGHSLQVAVSALRRALEPDAPRGRWRILRREGENYRLALRSDADADVRVLAAHLAAARRQDPAEAAASHRLAVETYAGDLLPGAGPADWVVDDRDRLRRAVAESCEHLAERAGAGGDHRAAARLAERGLDLDLHRDSLWQRLVAALRAAGDPIAANRAQERYERLLTDLGVSRPG